MRRWQEERYEEIHRVWRRSACGGDLGWGLVGASRVFASPVERAYS